MERRAGQPSPLAASALEGPGQATRDTARRSLEASAPTELHSTGSRVGRCPPPPQPPTFWEDHPHFQVAGGESNDGGLVQLRGDGRGQGQQLGQLVELAVLLLPPSPGCILGLLFHGGFFPLLADQLSSAESSKRGERGSLPANHRSSREVAESSRGGFRHHPGEREGCAIGRLRMDRGHRSAAGGPGWFLNEIGSPAERNHTWIAREEEAKTADLREQVGFLPLRGPKCNSS